MARSRASSACPFNPAGPSAPLQEGEADADIHASNGIPDAPDEANSIATGTGVVVANEGMNELAGNPNFFRRDGTPVVIDAPDYTANDSNDEFYGDASSIAAQGTVIYQYSGALPDATVPIPPGCTFYIKGDAPGASLIDLSNTPYDPPVQTLAQVVSGIDNAVSNHSADVISESFGAPYIPGTPDANFFESVDNAAVAAGVTVVASAGDSGDSGTVLAPAADPNVIAAAAVDNFRLVAMDDGYSSYVSNVNTYNIDVPAGASQLTANLQTADVSADNTIIYYLVAPDGTVGASASTPNTTAGQPAATATLTTADPAAGTWEIDVELGLTVSGNEFTQTVYGTVTDTG